MPPASQSHFATGDLLAGRYRVESVLGEGGMGTVYRATEVATERPVAVKLMSAEFAEDADLVARFRREAKLLAKLDHPNLVQLLSVDAHDGVPMLVMKLVQGQTLSAVLRERQRLARGQALPVLDQLCAALDYLHARGVVHRDLKPGNVMLDGDGRVTVLDFGVSHHLGAARLTSPGEFIGTPNYMAPEQIITDEVSPAADIYALALLTWQLLVGEHPFGGSKKGVGAMLDLQVNAMPALASRANPAVPAPVARVLDRSLEKDPAARHPTARAFYEELVRAFGQDSTEGVRDDGKAAGPIPRDERPAPANDATAPQLRPVGVANEPSRPTRTEGTGRTPVLPERSRGVLRDGVTVASSTPLGQNGGLGQNGVLGRNGVMRALQVLLGLLFAAAAVWRLLR